MLTENQNTAFSYSFFNNSSRFYLRNYIYATLQNFIDQDKTVLILSAARRHRYAMAGNYSAFFLKHFSIETKLSSKS
jgi:hypothetical protein